MQRCRGRGLGGPRTQELLPWGGRGTPRSRSPPRSSLKPGLRDVTAASSRGRDRSQTLVPSPEAGGRAESSTLLTTAWSPVAVPPLGAHHSFPIRTKRGPSTQETPRELGTPCQEGARGREQMRGLRMVLAPSSLRTLWTFLELWPRAGTETEACTCDRGPAARSHTHSARPSLASCRRES